MAPNVGHPSIPQSNNNNNNNIIIINNNNGNFCTVRINRLSTGQFSG
jgi:hypothetical protein